MCPLKNHIKYGRCYIELDGALVAEHVWVMVGSGGLVVKPYKCYVTVRKSI